MDDKRRHAEHANHEAWAIPYADLLTLLLAFFVVMYAVSVVDVGKYRVMSNSLLEAFGVQVQSQEIELGDPSPTPDIMDDNTEQRSMLPMAVERRAAEFWHKDVKTQTTELLAEGQAEKAESAERAEIRQAISNMADEIQGSLGSLIEDDVIKVHQESYWLEIDINTSLLFSSGSAVVAAAARPVLIDVAHILSKQALRIHVEGHTDNVPISSSAFPSNWELASGRAASVVHLFAENGVNPRNMVAMGYGEFQPVANNTDETGRARNRRVAVIVLPGDLSKLVATPDEPTRIKGDYQAVLQREQMRVAPANTGPARPNTVNAPAAPPAAIAAPAVPVGNN